MEHMTESKDEITDEATSIVSTDLLKKLKEDMQKDPVMQVYIVLYVRAGHEEEHK